MEEGNGSLDDIENGFIDCRTDAPIGDGIPCEKTQCLFFLIRMERDQDSQGFSKEDGVRRKTAVFGDGCNINVGTDGATEASLWQGHIEKSGDDPTSSDDVR